MKPPLLRHVISLVFATPVFGIAVWCAISEPGWLNPWHHATGFFSLNLWPLVLPQLVCSAGIIFNGILAMRSLRINLAQDAVATNAG